MFLLDGDILRGAGSEDMFKHQFETINWATCKRSQTAGLCDIGVFM